MGPMESKRRPGRPKKFAVLLLARVYLTPEDLEKAQTIGQGNISEGVRQALRAFPLDTNLSL